MKSPPANRGKPKGIRRKLAGQKAFLSEKLHVSQVGEGADRPEFSLIRLIEDHLKYGIPKHSPVMRSLRKEVEAVAGMHVLRAVEEKDADFFSWVRGGLYRVRKPVDVKGVRVLEAAGDSLELHAAVQRSLLRWFLRELQKQYPGEPPLDAKDVRDVAAGLGFGFSLYRDRVREEDRLELVEQLWAMFTPLVEWPVLKDLADTELAKIGLSRVKPKSGR